MKQNKVKCESTYERTQRMRVQHLLWNKTKESAALIREQNERECNTPDKTHARECYSHNRTQRRREQYTW